MSDSRPPVDESRSRRRSNHRPPGDPPTTEADPKQGRGRLAVAGVPATLVALMLASTMMAALAPPATAYTPGETADGDRLEPGWSIGFNYTSTLHGKLFSDEDECGEDPLCLDDDNGDMVHLDDEYGVHMDPDVEHDVRLEPDKIDLEYYDEDGNGNAGVAYQQNISNTSWLDTASWTSGNSESNDTFERTTRNGADVLHWAVNGEGSSNPATDTWTLQIDDITNSVDKKHLIVGADAKGYGDADVDIHLQGYDGNESSGGRERFEWTDDGEDAVGPSVIANTTGVVFDDPKIVDGEHPGSSAGISGEIGKLDINFNLKSDDSIDFYLYALDIEDKRWTWGEDKNGDTVYNLTQFSDTNGAGDTGLPAHMNLSEFDPKFDNEFEDIQDLDVSAEVTAQSVPENQTDMIARKVEPNDGYAQALEYEWTQKFPDWVDWSLSNLNLETTTYVPGNRYTTADACGSDKTDTLEDVKEDKTEELNDGSGLGEGTECEITFTVQYTQSEYQAFSAEGYVVPGFGFVTQSTNPQVFAVWDLLVGFWNNTAARAGTLLAGGAYAVRKVRRRRTGA